jgi:RNA polymerase sigma factor (sigma-70 family)
LRRARAGQFQLADSEALWRVLCAITLTKVREQIRFHLRHKRGLDQETNLGLDATNAGSFDLVDPAPTPEQASAFADQFQRLLTGLTEEQRQLVDLKLQDCTNEEAAERMGCSERTVRRLLKGVQEQLARVFEVS